MDVILTEPERDAILAALRYWQRATKREEVFEVEFTDIYTNGGGHEGLSARDIDVLCEYLNGV